MNLVLTLAAAQLRADLRHARSGRRGAGRLATTVAAYGFSGIVLALSLGNAPAPAALFVGGSFGIVLAAFGVVGSYDELMGRPRDNAWLSTLPASEYQHYAARLMGIGLYVALMVVGIAVPVALRSGRGARSGHGASGRPGNRRGDGVDGAPGARRAVDADAGRSQGARSAHRCRSRGRC